MSGSHADDRLPILVGGSQTTSRVSTWLDAPTPLDLLERVTLGAAEQAGRRCLDAIDLVVALPTSSWAERNPAAALAGRLGISARRTALTGHGGELGVTALNWIATEILHGRAGTTLLVGANGMRTTDLALADGTELEWPAGPHRHPLPEHVGGEDRKPTHDEEDAAGLVMPIHLYPIIENALRAERGLGPDEHRARLGRLFAPFTAVAARNPHAWFPIERSAEELITPGPRNRMVAYPYTKYLCAVLSVDQAAALVVTSVGEARRLGIPEERWVHWWGGGGAVERAYPLSTRPALARSSAMADAHGAALRNAGVGVDEVARFDLYSCFPAAVEVACDVLGLDEDDPRGLTVTGGLPYAGGPASGYTLHALATMADVLRAEPDDIGLVTGNGMYLSKHSAAVLSARPPRSGTPTADTTPTRSRAEEPLPVVRRSGPGVVEGYTVLHDRTGVPERGAVIGRFADGARFVASVCDDAESLRAFEADEQVGRRGRVAQTPAGLRFEPA